MSKPNKDAYYLYNRLTHCRGNAEMMTTDEVQRRNEWLGAFGSPNIRWMTETEIDEYSKN